MDKREQIEDWRGSVTVAIGALTAFGLALVDWGDRDADDAEFMAEFGRLYDAGLEGWIDGNPLDVDRLRAAVVGEELPEAEPMTEDAIIEKFFGK